MKKRCALFVALLFTVTGAFAQAGGYQLGQKVQNFSLKDSSGKTVSLSDFTDARTVVVVFTSTHCPYSRLYETRLLNLIRAYNDKGVRFVFINPAIGQEESGETIQDMADKQFTVPFLADDNQRVSNQFGATKVPEVFVLHNVNNEFVLKYKGAIDDNPQVEDYVKEYYLKNAIDAILTNQSIKSFDKRATGCMIRKF
jgi:peroxiredoxin